MIDALPTTDTTASLAAKTVGDIFNDVIPIVESAAIVAQPWLGDPVVKPFWEAIFNWIVGLFSGAFSTSSGYVVMDVQDFFALKTAATALANLQAAQQSGDANAITQANSAIDAAVAPILHFIGTDS